MKALIAAIVTVLFLAGCGSDPSSGLEPATSTPTVAPSPTPPTSTATPVPTIALPTVTPIPTADPETAFIEWLAGKGYRFRVNVNDGSKRYLSDSDENSISVDVGTDNLIISDLVFGAEEAALMLREATSIAIAAIEVRGYDAEPVRSALAQPYQLPLTLPLPSYSFVIVNRLYPSVASEAISVHVIFFEAD